MPYFSFAVWPIYGRRGYSTNAASIIYYENKERAELQKFFLFFL